MVDALQQAYRLAQEGEELFNRQDYLTAIARWKSAAHLYEQQEYWSNVSELYVNIAIALQHQAEIFFQNNQTDDAIEYYKNASAIYAELKHLSEYASCQDTIARIYYHLGDNTLALDHFTLAKRVWEKHGEVKKTATSEYFIGLCLTGLGNPRAALQCQKKARSLIEESEQPSLMASIELEIGKILRFYGKDSQPDVIKHIGLALSLYRKQNMPEGVAACESLLGEIFASQMDYARSLIHFNNAKSFWKSVIAQQDSFSAPSQIEMATVETHIARVLTLEENYSEALRLLKTAEKVFHRTRNIPKVSWVHQNISDCLFRQNKYSEAFRWAKNALDGYKQYGLLREQCIAYRDMAKALAKMERFHQAIPYYEKSLQLFESLRGQESSLDFKKSVKKDYLEIYYDLCLSYLVMYEKHGSKEYLTKAINNIELSKCSAIAESLATDSSLALCPEMDHLFRLEQALLDQALKKVTDYEKLSRVSLDGSISKAQYRSSLNNIEKEYDELQERIATVRGDIVVKCSDYGTTAMPREYNVIKKAVSHFPQSEKWHILEFAVLEKMETLVVFLIESNGSIEYARQAMSEETFDLVAQCREVVQNMREFDEKGANSRLRMLSEHLYMALIPPSIGQRLKDKEISQLVVVPHSYLHWIPFEILFDGEDFWGLRYALSSNYSMDLTRLCINKRQQKVPDDTHNKPSFLLLANPLLDLDGSDQEVKKLQELLAEFGVSAQTIQREKATKQAFIEAIGERSIDVVHYSGHAQYMGNNPSLSALYLHTDQICEACEGRGPTHAPAPLTASEISRTVRFDGAPIIFLSGCETGINEIEPGDEMFGLFRSLMFAGATSFVLSRWLVNDRIAVLFAEKFYQHLYDGNCVAVALQKARTNVFEKDPDHFTHWSAFTMQGDPFRRFSTH